MLMRPLALATAHGYATASLMRPFCLCDRICSCDRTPASCPPAAATIKAYLSRCAQMSKIAVAYGDNSTDSFSTAISLYLLVRSKLAYLYKIKKTFKGTPIIKHVTSHASAGVPTSEISASISNANNSSSQGGQKIVSNRVSVEHAVNPEPAATSGLSGKQEEAANIKVDVTGSHDPLETAVSMVAADSSVPIELDNSMTTPITATSISPWEASPPSVNETPDGGLEETNEIYVISGSENIIAPEEKKVEHGPVVYEKKEEANNVFKVLLETTYIGSDWNWTRP